MKVFTVKEDCSLRDFTDANYPQGGFCFNQLLKDREIKINGSRTGSDVKLHAGDEVAYYTTRAQERALSHKIVYEDENIVVADKYSGVSSEGLYAEINARTPVKAVHRLDRNTQGLIVFAKTPIAERELLKAFKEHRAHKTYLALCKNAFKQPEAKMTAYLMKNPRDAFVTVYGRPVVGAQRIITEYRVVKEKGDLALVEIVLHTGKTHQIRAHMAYIGCPVLGDGKYGDGELNAKYSARRQCLVAKYLRLDIGGQLGYLGLKTFESGFTPKPPKAEKTPKN